MSDADTRRAWTLRDMPDQSGRTAVVTGANAGLGYETALALAAAGAEVVLAARNPSKGAAAMAKIQAAHPEAAVRFERLDLASLASITDFAARMAATCPRIDLLVNNAGVMTLPKREVTADGFERQFGTNHLGHFALTLRLLPLLRRGASPRVTTVSSMMSKTGRIDFDDLQAERRYSPTRAYAQSKLANLLFTLELQRRSDDAGWGLLSDAAHPGIADTELVANGPGVNSVVGRVFALTAKPLFSQPAAVGALPSLLAATSPAAVKGGYYGPSRRFEMAGPPDAVAMPKLALDAAAAARLWQVSERLTGVSG